MERLKEEVRNINKINNESELSDLRVNYGKMVEELEKIES